MMAEEQWFRRLPASPIPTARSTRQTLHVLGYCDANFWTDQTAATSMVGGLSTTPPMIDAARRPAARIRSLRPEVASSAGHRHRGHIHAQANAAYARQLEAMAQQPDSVWRAGPAPAPSPQGPAPLERVGVNTDAHRLGKDYRIACPQLCYGRYDRAVRCRSPQDHRLAPAWRSDDPRPPVCPLRHRPRRRPPPGSSALAADCVRTTASPLLFIGRRPLTFATRFTQIGAAAGGKAIP